MLLRSSEIKKTLLLLIGSQKTTSAVENLPDRKAISIRIIYHKKLGSQEKTFLPLISVLITTGDINKTNVFLAKLYDVYSQKSIKKQTTEGRRFTNTPFNLQSVFEEGSSQGMPQVQYERDVNENLL